MLTKLWQRVYLVILHLRADISTWRGWVVLGTAAGAAWYTYKKTSGGKLKKYGYTAAAFLATAFGAQLAMTAVSPTPVLNVAPTIETHGVEDGEGF